MMMKNIASWNDLALVSKKYCFLNPPSPVQYLRNICMVGPLVCHATGRPEPTIIWKREDGKAFHVKSTKRMGKKYNCGMRLVGMSRLRDF